MHRRNIEGITFFEGDFKKHRREVRNARITLFFVLVLLIISSIQF